MNRLIFVLFILWLSCCNNSNRVTDDNARMVDSVLAPNDTASATTIQLPFTRLSVLVLPPFDEIANEGISPGVQEYLEREISKDTSVTLIEFPYKDLMNVPYHNVFDKKYCKPITDRIDADVVIMTKLDQEERTG